MHSDRDGCRRSGTAAEPASCYCGSTGLWATAAHRSQWQVAAAHRLPPLGEGRGELISQPSSLNETPRTQLHLHGSRHQHMKVCNPIFAGDVAFTFAHIKAAQDMMLHVWGASDSPHSFLQTGPKSGVCLSVLRGSQLGGWMNASYTRLGKKEYPVRAPSSYSTVAWQPGLCDPVLDNQAPSTVGLGVAVATSSTVTPARVTASALWADGPAVCCVRLQKTILLNYWQTIFQPVSLPLRYSLSHSFFSFSQCSLCLYGGV